MIAMFARIPFTPSLFLLGVPLFFCSCAPTPESAPIPRDALVTEQTQALAISEVSLSMNLPSDTAWANVHAILERQQITISQENRHEGKIETDWKQLTDYLCGAYGTSNAPLECDVRFWFHVTPISGSASSVKIRYEEVCRDVPGGTLECPRSNAERLLLGIARDIEVTAGIVRE